MSSLLRSSTSAALRQASRAAAAAPRAAPSATMLLHTTRAVRATEKDPQLGDYPAIEYPSRQLRKFSPQWWDTQEKYNAGETLHEEEDLKSVWAPDLHENVPARSALFQLLIAAGVAGAFAGLVYFMRASPPALPKAFPREGLADELGGPQVAAFTGEEESSEEEEEDDE